MPKPTRRQRKRSTSDAALELSGTPGSDSGTNPKVTAHDLQGLTFFNRIRPMLQSLHGVGTERDKAGNRELHMDQYCVLVLMWMFNPVLTSMRGLQPASTLADVQRKFGVGSSSLGSLSESVSIFAPEPFKQIAAMLATEVPSADPSRFDVIGQQLTAVDGSVFKTAVRVASLAWLPSKGNGKNKGTPVNGYPMHTHFEILRGIPERIDATAAKPKGQSHPSYSVKTASEQAACRAVLLLTPCLAHLCLLGQTFTAGRPASTRQDAQEREFFVFRVIFTTRYNPARLS